MPRANAPGAIRIPDCIETKIHWATPEGQFSNVMHGNLVAAGPINPALGTTLFSALRAHAATAAWLGALSTDVSLTGVSVKDLRATHNPEYPSTGVAAPGTAVDAGISISNALVVTLRTGQSGRGFRGRVYLAGLTITAMVNTRRFSDAVGLLATNFVGAIDEIWRTNAIPLVLAQRELLADPTAPPGTEMASPRAAAVVPITAWDIANPRIDSQRKRLGR